MLSFFFFFLLSLTPFNACFIGDCNNINVTTIANINCYMIIYCSLVLYLIFASFIVIFISFILCISS